jgi:hypothetical protein
MCIAFVPTRSLKGIEVIGKFDQRGFFFSRTLHTETLFKLNYLVAYMRVLLKIVLRKSLEQARVSRHLLVLKEDSAPRSHLVVDKVSYCSV